MPFMFIFPRIEYGNYFVRYVSPDCIGPGNSSGWVTKVEFKLFETHFIDNGQSFPFNPVPLTLDNRSSHLDIQVVEMAKENNVILLSSPSYCSHNSSPGMWRSMDHLKIIVPANMKLGSEVIRLKQ